MYNTIDKIINNYKGVLNKFKQNSAGLDAIVFMEYRKPPYIWKLLQTKSKIKLMKGKALRKHSLHGKIAASVLF